MLTPDAAWGAILKHCRPLPTEHLSLRQAVGGCLAETVRADRDQPPADRSAMDGFAVRHADLTTLPRTLRLVGEVAAGSAARPRVTAGACARILTGGNVPPGADTVVRLEDTAEQGDVVTIREAPKRGANILWRGENARRDAIVLVPGARLQAPQMGACAAMGKARLRVHRHPRVAVLCTGEELRAVHERVRVHEIRDSNGPTLCAALAQWGYAATLYRSVPDNLRVLVTWLKRAAMRCEAIVLTGGVSVGKYDYVTDAVRALGARIRFHGVAMKPGRPVLYATLPHGRHIFGLPGNPVSALSGFHEFVLPALHRMAGRPAPQCRLALWLPLDAPLKAKPGRVRYIPARLIWGPTDVRVDALASRGSADLVAAGAADGAIVVPAETAELAAGAVVAFRPWRPLP